MYGLKTVIGEEVKKLKKQARTGHFVVDSSDKTDWRNAWDSEFRFLGELDVVHSLGRYWTPQPLPKGYRMGGRPKQCGKNAWGLALRDSSVTYVEGYAYDNLFSASRGDWTGHAWVVDRDGLVIDPTWNPPGIEYFGVPIKTDYLREVSKGARHTVLNDWWNGFPLLKRKRPVSTWKSHRTFPLPPDIQESPFRQDFPPGFMTSIYESMRDQLCFPDQHNKLKENQIRLQKALNAMDPSDRHVIALVNVEGLSNAEVASVLGFSKSTASMQYNRAIHRLREILFHGTP